MSEIPSKYRMCRLLKWPESTYFGFDIKDGLFPLEFPFESQRYCIDWIEPNSPAMLAGLRPGDVILEINQIPLISRDTQKEAVRLINMIRDEVTLFVVDQETYRENLRQNANNFRLEDDIKITCYQTPFRRPIPGIRPRPCQMEDVFPSGRHFVGVLEF